MAQPARLVVPWCERLSCICAPRDSWMPGGRWCGGCHGRQQLCTFGQGDGVGRGTELVGTMDDPASNVQTCEVLTVQPCNITIFMLPNIFILSSGNWEPSNPISQGTEAKTLGPFESSVQENPYPRRPFLDT